MELITCNLINIFNKSVYRCITIYDYDSEIVNSNIPLRRYP